MKIKDINNLIAKHKIPLASIAVLKNYSFSILINEKKLFQVASVSKCFTALCVMKLVERRKLRLNKDVNKYLKGWKIRNKKGKLIEVTLRELLSHTAGISCSGFKGYQQNQKVPTLYQILNGDKPANNERIYKKFRRGIYRYSGGGYEIIHKILEDVLNKPFSEIVEKEILSPLKMKRSTFKTIKNKNIIQEYIYPEKAAAGLWTTAEDLAKFLITIQLCYKGKSNFIPKHLAKEMLKPITKAEGVFVSSGFFISNDKKKFYHTGHNIGYRSKFISDFRGNGIIILTNKEESNRFINILIKNFLFNLKK